MNQQDNLSKLIYKISKDSLNSTKTCYVSGCNNPCIKAHSVSNSRYLKKIATKGEVFYMSAEKQGESLSLIPTGKMKATTFPGFCDLHDKYFSPLDDSDYIIGNEKQNFLFAFRAAAREYTVRQGVEKMLKDAVANRHPELNMPEQGRQRLKDYLVHFTVGTADLEVYRTVLNINFSRGRYWKLHTEVLVLDKEYPIVASSIFKLERDNKDKVINVIHDLKAIARPFFFTIIPQNGKTYCIMSWCKRDESYYSNLHELQRLSNYEKKVVISNLLTSYVENFAVKPEYWDYLPKTTLDNFYKQWGRSMHAPYVPFIYDKGLSLFRD